MNKFIQKLNLFFLTVLVAGCFSVAAQKQLALHEGEAKFEPPGELIDFTEAGTKIIAYAEADLNADGTLDYIVVLEYFDKPKLSAEMNNRPTLIIVRDFKGILTVAARSEQVVFCRGCVGGMSDPLEEIETRQGGFSIVNRAGNRQRWIGRWDFKYSPRGRNWQLARVTESNYNELETKPFWTKTYTSPKDFGKIDFVDFNPDDFKGKGVSGSQRKDQIKMREANIFLLKGSPGEGDIVPFLVPVKRQVSAKTPLAGAIRALLEGAADNDGDDVHEFIHGLKFVSAQIRNKTARIDFKYDKEQLEDGEEFSWGATMREFFPDAVERTALQFKGIDRVVVCVEGLESYMSPDDFYHRKCPKYWWKE